MTRIQILIVGVIGLVALGLLGAGAWVILHPTDAPSSLETVPTSTAVQSSATPLPETPTLQTLSLPQAMPSRTPSSFDPLACLGSEAGTPVEMIEALADGVLRVRLDGQAVDVKLLGIDPAGPGGQALGLIRELTDGQPLSLISDVGGADASGRLLRYVRAGDHFLNYELVRRGAALPALFPPGQSCADTLLTGEQQARSEGLGYWSLGAGLDPTYQPLATATGLPCDCSVAYQCSDFKAQREAQACYNACGDYRNMTLDDDRNGVACEQLP